jgi:hypothetical protein
VSRAAALLIAFVLVAGSARADEPVAPSSAQLLRAVHAYVDQSLDVRSCDAPIIVSGELRYECSRTECPGGCEVVHVVTVIGFRAGRFRLVSRRNESQGDTGECGCCLEAF